MRGWRAGERGAAARCLSPAEEGLRRNIFGDCGTSICQVVSWTLELPGAPSNLEGLRGLFTIFLHVSTLGCWVQPGGAWRAERPLAEQSGGNLGPSSAR